LADDPFVLDRTVRRGVAEPVAPGVRRIVANNPSPMTFTGTASYLVGEWEVAVIDPGPRDSAHFAAMREALPRGARVTAILVTHSHLDHSPGSVALAEWSGAPVYAFGPHGSGMSDRMRALQEAGLDLGGGEGADHGFQCHRPLAHGDAVEGADWRLTALHTPGHLSNHLCFALDGTGVVFTGDHVMGWSTSMISPPEGDMTAFIASLRKLQGRGDTLYLPGHGPPVTDVEGMLAWQIAHRAAREAQILAALADGPLDPAELVRRIYAEIDSVLWPAARRNVLAHLLSLAEQGKVVGLGVLSDAARFELAAHA
jgi:hydroxyacylglutathione hydrolase